MKAVSGFKKIGVSRDGNDLGTVTIDLGKKSIECKAIRYTYGDNNGDNEYETISIHGFVGKYRTGKKVWRCSVTLEKDGSSLRCWFGRDDRGEFYKSDVSYNPELFDTLWQKEVAAKDAWELFDN